MTTFTPLSEHDEDALHHKRLLNVEEKHFQKVRRRLLAPSNPIQEYLRCADQELDGDYAARLAAFQRATLYDFSALSSNLARLQFLLSANEKERERYARQTTTVKVQQEDIRQDTARLRVQLAEAKEQLHVRKSYDVLAEKVLYVNTNEKVRSKTREELGRESEKLRNEIDELEREGIELEAQWSDRRQALAGVMHEAARLRRVVRGEAEDEAMRDDSDAEDEEDQRREEDEEHQGLSHAGTPKPMDDGGTTPVPEHSASGGLTPVPASGHDSTGAFTPKSDRGDESTKSGDVGSTLKHEMHQDIEDTKMMDDQQGTIPQVKIDDVDKAELSEMDTA